jgi:hypothetical protein
MTVTNTITYAQANEPESVKALRECIDLQMRKSRDYQNPNSTVKQADYYPSGVKTIHEICHAKMLRALSVMEAMEKDPNYNQNFESLEDSFKDLINYASFAISYCRGQIPGQSKDHDMFNRKINIVKVDKELS